ncbi:hypothetical protein QN277_028110 [Acacia crassicarpa]|uniref:Receptor-like serine/threonine-protein kinase n=1 Tax=Acacia crassicarpa TaxID=499986 RepID=A0AAE1J535_9FABA|nr:hypothetical protein QN277_028110 [Acacia crassicarpa]
MAIRNIFFFLALFLLHFHHLAFANVPLNKTLSTNDQNASWNSPSGEFAFGFRPIENTELFLLAIWFNNIPSKTIVWYANMPNPAVPAGSRVQLTPTGLNLTNPQGQAMWTTGELQGDVSYAEMRDGGNFVLASSNSSYLWQSFNYPTDTLLPNQTLPLNSNLSSHLTPTNYSKGRFELYFDNGNLLLSQIGWPTESRYTNYFSVSSATNDNDSALQLVFDTSNLYVEARGGDRKPLGPEWSALILDVNGYYYRATLDYYGVFTLYSHPKESLNQVWSVVTNVPPNICQAPGSDMGSGSCGYNSYCSWDDYNRRPTCNCPGGYSWVDPNDEFGGCKPDFSFDCGADDERSQENPEEVFEMKPLLNVNWPLGDYEKLINYTLDECIRSCLYDCNCAAVVPNAAKDCWKKRFPLSNGRYGDAKQGFTTTFFKKRIDQPGVNSPHPADQDRVQLALLGSLIGSLVIITLLVATVVSIILLKPKKVVKKVSSFFETNMHSFTYEALKEATHGFSEEVGRGSFGIVYKGTLNSMTNTVIAVKRLDRVVREREKEFRNELSAIGRTCHRNLVRLIGFCDEEIHRLLVYDFMSNGTLADILFKQPKPIWNLRVSLALGIARGLLYLHEECDTPIIHCDIKPQNILIDEHFMPKISDFGLAKLLYSNKSRTHTMIRGTRGYVAPEWFKNVPVTAKVDVYSYGVMLLEIICCTRSLEMDLDEVEEGEAILVDWAYDCYMEGRIEILVENDKEAMADMKRLKKWVMIAIWCIQENPETRPSMKTVMQMLEGLVEVPCPPTPQSFFPIV